MICASECCCFRSVAHAVGDRKLRRQLRRRLLVAVLVTTGTDRQTGLAGTFVYLFEPPPGQRSTRK